MTAIPDDVTSMLADLFASNEADRKRRYTELLEAMSEREKLIFRDAAIAGFVQGTRYAGLTPSVGFPRDPVILENALGCIDRYPDLYPTVSGYVPDGEDE